jgi:hypothetical protein
LHREGREAREEEIETFAPIAREKLRGRMRDFKIPQAVAMILLAGALTAAEAQSADVKTEVTQLLSNFLAKVDDPAMHERFWADDLIYTGSSGAVRTKPEILKSVREGASQPQDPKAPKVTFGAEEITVRQFGDTAVLNFKLVQHIEGKPDNFFRNSGTLVKRDGKWQVVSWQATRVEPEKK